MRKLAFLLTLWMIFCLASSSAVLAKPKHFKNKRIHKFVLAQNFSRQLLKGRALASKSIWKAQRVLYGNQQLTQELNRIIHSESRDVQVAVYVKSMKYGDALYSYNIHKPLTPASTLKVLTAEAALIYLGSGYRFSTQLLTDAKSIKKGVLQGNLYVVLSGDPSLTYDDLIDLLLALKLQHQIHAIAGNVYIDNTAYDQRFY